MHYCFDNNIKMSSWIVLFSFRTTLIKRFDPHQMLTTVMWSWSIYLQYLTLSFISLFLICIYNLWMQGCVHIHTIKDHVNTQEITFSQGPRQSHERNGSRRNSTQTSKTGQWQVVHTQSAHSTVAWFRYYSLNHLLAPKRAFAMSLFQLDATSGWYCIHWGRHFPLVKVNSCSPVCLVLLSFGKQLRRKKHVSLHHSGKKKKCIC